MNLRTTPKLTIPLIIPYAYTVVYTLSSLIQKKTYTVVITKDMDDGGFVGRCNKLHANSQGETYKEVMENMKEAIELAAEDKRNNFNLNIIQKF